MARGVMVPRRQTLSVWCGPHRPIAAADEAASPTIALDVGLAHQPTPLAFNRICMVPVKAALMADLVVNILSISTVLHTDKLMASPYGGKEACWLEHPPVTREAFADD